MALTFLPKFSTFFIYYYYYFLFHRAQLENTDVSYFCAPFIVKQHLNRNLMTAVTAVVIHKKKYHKMFFSVKLSLNNSKKKC